MRGRGMPGHGETRHPLESALSTGIRIPPPCLPPGSSQQPLASSPPLLPQQRIHVPRAAWSLGPAERSCQALLSTSYQTGKRGLTRKTRMVIKIQFSHTSVPEGPPIFFCALAQLFRSAKGYPGSPCSSSLPLLRLITSISTLLHCAPRSPLTAQREGLAETARGEEDG